MARAHVAHLARFWHARRRDLRKTNRLDTARVAEPLTHDRTADSVASQFELLELALARLTERDRQILDWCQEKVAWLEIARRLNVPSAEALRKQHERAITRVAEAVCPVE